LSNGPLALSLSKGPSTFFNGLLAFSAVARRGSRQTGKSAARSTPSGARAGPSPVRGSRAALLSVLLVVATLVAYQPVWQAGFIWDDNDYITENPTLHDLEGLRRIWFDVGAVPQYYPLVYTVFWLQARLWGFAPLGYHLVNVVLHATAALLLARCLIRVRVPGAWLAAFLFALHPVCVESVAWVTELKNVLSTAFYLAAALAYRRFLDRRGGPNQADGRGWYAGALLLFAAALLSKTVTCSLPAALLLVRWWETGRLGWADVRPTLPFVVLGVALGLHTASVEKHHLGAEGLHWSMSFAERCLVAGRALWFYAGKLLWPAHLTFIYPRWNLDPALWWQWLFPAAALAAIAALWLFHRRIGRGPFAALAFFAGTLVPALGFFDVYMMRYTFVADHFQYLASIGPIVFAAALLHTLSRRWTRRAPWLGPALGTALLLPLGATSWAYAATFTNLETLWTTTIARNPDCSMAHNNLGQLFLARNQTDVALAHFRKAVQIDPNNAEARDSLGTVLLQRGDVDEALAHFQSALRVEPDRVETHYNLGTALLRQARLDEAIAEFETVLRRQPHHAMAHNNLGNAFFERGRMEDALGHYRQALQYRPDLAEAANNAGSVLLRGGQIDAAIEHYQKALALRPQFPEAADDLRNVAWILATHPDGSVRDGARAVHLAGEVDRRFGSRDALAAATLAAAYAEAGRFGEAIATAKRALRLATARNDTELAGELRSQLGSYEAGRALRDSG
jgi:tetratricopeptide (TPR) repeat protein